MLSMDILKKRWMVLLGGVALLLVGAIAGSAISAHTSWLPFSRAASANERASSISLYLSKESPLGGAISLNEGLGPVVRQVREGVVSISSTKVTKAQVPSAPFFDDPLFRRFFGPDSDRQGPRERELRQTALGSGVVVSPEGYILTNNHVVAGATELKVSFSDKREVSARIIGTDRATDLAVIKVDAQGLPGVPMGDSDKIQVGDFALAIGNPFNLGNTVTFGIISATGRGNLGIAQYGDFIQTDAAINPGNSGGALVNMRGELIGINTAIFTQGFEHGNQGVGFAIPINMGRQVMEQLLRKGKVVRGYLGLLPQDVTPALAEEFGLRKDQQGAVVGSVESGTPADQAGIRVGDVIIELNGERIANADKLRQLVAQVAPDTKVTLKLLREGKELSLTAVLKERPDGAQTPAPEELGKDNPLGDIEVDDLTPETLRQLQLPPGTSGVVITQVSPGSRAAEAGLQPRDIIQQINREPVNNLQDFRRIAGRVGNKRIVLLVKSKGWVVIEPLQQ